MGAPAPTTSRWWGWDSNPGSLALKPILFPLSQAASAESPARWLWVLLCSFSHPGVCAAMACHVVVGVRQVASGRNSEGLEPPAVGERTQKHSRGAHGGASAAQTVLAGWGREGCQPASPSPAPPSCQEKMSAPSRQGRPLTSGILIHRSLCSLCSLLPLSEPSGWGCCLPAWAVGTWQRPSYLGPSLRWRPGEALGRGAGVERRGRWAEQALQVWLQHLLAGSPFQFHGPQ